jgi:hypothetical protein
MSIRQTIKKILREQSQIKDELIRLRDEVGLEGAIKYVGDAYSSAPNVLLVPLQEYAALRAPLSADFAIAGSSRLQILENMLTLDPDKPFKVQPMQYCDKDFNNLGVNRYMLMDNSEGDFKLAMSIPYTSTIYGSVDNFIFNSRQFAQFTGVVITRPKAVYFSFA